MEAVRYSEWVPARALVKGLMVMFSAIIVFGTFALFQWGTLSIEGIVGLALGLGILAFILFLFWNYRGPKFKSVVVDSLLSMAYLIGNHFC